MDLHKINQRAHAKRRAAERFGIELNKHSMRELVRAIQNKKSLLVERCNNRCTAHVLYFGGTIVKVVYDKHRKAPVTFVYPNQDEIRCAIKRLQERNQ